MADRAEPWSRIAAAPWNLVPNAVVPPCEDQPMKQSIGQVALVVREYDEAIDFYVGTLGFEKIVDVPMGPGQRWVEVQLPGTETAIARAPPP